MLDLRWIREYPEEFNKKLKTRGHEPVADQVLMLDKEHRHIQTQLQELQTERNNVAKCIGLAKQQGDAAAAQRYMARANEIKDHIPALEQKERDIEHELKSILETLPNLPLDEVPVGTSENDNVQVRQWGEPRSFTFKPKHHYELGESLNIMDFEQAAKIAGSRFVILKKELARLERALASFMLDIHTQEFGYEEIVPPFLMRASSVYGVGQLPKFEEDLFKTTDDRYLLSTGEVPLTNMAADQIFAQDDLPLRYTAYTPCFRSEAGSAGRDTRGMIRQHQFTKVELVSITTPDQAMAEHERMTGAAEEILKRLVLPYRVMLLCTGDIGAASEKTYDLEVWLPSENAYREISSCSVCGHYQARRMNARFRPNGEKTKPEHVVTLNGSGLPIGRTIVAILENYQQGDGSVQVPEVLIPYMGGIEVIR